MFLESSPDALSPSLSLPPSSTSSSFLFSSSLPPPSAVILISKERPAEELQLVVVEHLPSVEIEARRQIGDFKYASLKPYELEI